MYEMSTNIVGPEIDEFKQPFEFKYKYLIYLHFDFCMTKLCRLLGASFESDCRIFVSKWTQSAINLFQCMYSQISIYDKCSILKKGWESYTSNNRIKKEIRH